MSLDIPQVMGMSMGIVLLPRTAQVLLAGFWTGAGATAGCGVITDISIGGAEVVGVGVSLARQQSFQMQKPMAKVQIAAPIMAAGEVKAQ
jgi:hypothetical protein